MTLPTKILSPSNILRGLLAVTAILSLFLLEGQYAACLAVLFVWLLLVDQKGYLLPGTAAVLLGFAAYLLLGPSFASFVLSLVPIMILSLFPERQRSSLGNFWTRSAGPSVFSSPQEARRERRRKLNDLVRRWK